MIIIDQDIRKKWFEHVCARQNWPEDYDDDDDDYYYYDDDDDDDYYYYYYYHCYDCCYRYYSYHYHYYCHDCHFYHDRYFAMLATTSTTTATTTATTASYCCSRSVLPCGCCVRFFSCLYDGVEVPFACLATRHR